MKVVLLAAGNSIHTIRWANGLADRGLDVYLISAHECSYELREDVKFYLLDGKTPFSYFTAQNKVRRLISKIQPDLVNAHYATGYGLLARMVGFMPTLLSVWGSDVYDFPEKTMLHRRLVYNNLEFATAIASTSRCMAGKVAEIYNHPACFITPFGVDVDMFSPVHKTEDNNDKIIVGTVKSLSKRYGIDILIQSFSYALDKLSNTDNIYLEISGSGSENCALNKMVADMKLEKRIKFHGKIPHEQVPDKLNTLDIYVALSKSESFGVAILEAASCGKPVIVSDAEGLAEVTRHKVNGLIVPKDNPKAAGEAIIKMINDKNMRLAMGRAGRKHVLENYSWSVSLDLMINAYENTVKQFHQNL